MANDLAADCIQQFNPVGTVAQITRFLKNANDPGGEKLQTLDSDALKSNCDEALSYWQSLGLPEANATDSAPSSEVAPSSAPSDETPPGAVSDSFDVTTPDGYQYQVAYQVTYGAPAADPSQATPGNTDVSVPVNGTLTVTDTTPGGHALPDGWFDSNAVSSLSVLQLFPAGSPECNSMNVSGNCLMLLGAAFGSSTIDAASSASLTFQGPGPSAAAGVPTGSAGLHNVPEASASTVESDFTSSPKLVITATSAEGGSDSCSISGTVGTVISPFPSGFGCNNISSTI